MANNFSLTGLAATSDIPKDELNNSERLFRLPILDIVSYSIALICALFFVIFAIDESISVSWFFISEIIALCLIPILSRQGFEVIAKFLLILYVDIAIIILSSMFDGEAEIQYFLIPAMGLSILLFDSKNTRIRNVSIFISVISYFVIDFITVDRVSLNPEAIDYVRWGVIAAAFVTTWIIFNTFSESKERAEQITREFLEKEKELNKQLSLKQDELQDYIEKLETTSEKLKKSSSAKSDFLATMSHEIRTPMNAILGMTHFLKEDDPREDQLESINIIDFSAKTLLSLIDDILDFSKIDAGKIEFESTEFELIELISTISETFRSTAQNKKVELSTEIGKNLPKYLKGDPAKLIQILNNLVSNALKFTDKGSVKIFVQCVAEKNKKVDVEFRVTDSGVGIEQSRLDSIFESFVQADKKTKRLYGGTGLGLSISKKLVELQGGSISVKSKPEKGSEFSVILSFDKAENKENTDAGRVEIKEEHITGLKVLVAEDNLVNQKVMESFLRKWEVDATIVDNGLEVIEELKKTDFDLILMDLEMPEMDGYEAATLIRKMEDSTKKNVPIIALTAAALSDVKEKVYSVGMNDFVTKPFNPVELRRKLSEIDKNK
jgi:signal transduction histidine kinase/ActR/RegA family two-component response regulator